MKYYFREYLGEKDDQHIRDFLTRVYGVTHHPYYSVDPSNWERMRVSMRQPTNKLSIQLLEEDQGPSKKLVGVMVYEKYRDKYSYLVDPNYGEDIERSICDWVETEHCDAKKEAEKIVIGCSVCEKNDTQKAILTQRGYFKGALDTVFRQRSLEGFSSVPALPGDYQIIDRQDCSGEFFEKRARIENQVFDRAITVEFLKELQRTPLYQPELDLVIMAPDGSLAAFCTIWFDNANNVGYVEPIGTEVDHRRRGLAKALLIEGFQRLQKLGIKIVYLGNNAHNTAGNLLYESVEMPVFDQEYLWHKEL